MTYRKFNKLEIPDGINEMCDECLFNYDTITCKYYKRNMMSEESQEGKPLWCKAISVTVEEREE